LAAKKEQRAVFPYGETALCYEILVVLSALKVRPSTLESNEYLKSEELIRDENAILNDEKLIKAIFRVSENNQMVRAYTVR